MSSLPHMTLSVQPIPTDSDGTIVPRLIPVAAYLCCEQYDDAARDRILSRLADGVSPRVCCLVGALEWGDLAEVERLVARRPYAGAPASADHLLGVARVAARASGSVLRSPDGSIERDAVDLFAPVDDFPRLKTRSDYEQDLADVREWYREHVGRED